MAEIAAEPVLCYYCVYNNRHDRFSTRNFRDFQPIDRLRTIRFSVRDFKADVLYEFPISVRRRFSSKRRGTFSSIRRTGSPV